MNESGWVFTDTRKFYKTDVWSTNCRKGKFMPLQGLKVLRSHLEAKPDTNIYVYEVKFLKKIPLKEFNFNEQDKALKEELKAKQDKLDFLRDALFKRMGKIFTDRQLKIIVEECEKIGGNK